LYDADGFSDVFGKVFQRYVGQVLEAANSNGSYDTLPEHEYWVGKERKDSIDWIASDPTGDLFLECKTKRLRLDAKIGAGATQAMHDDLDKMADFVVQTYKTLEDGMNAKYPHWTPRARPIYPIVVVLEEWFVFGSHMLDHIDKAVTRKMQAKGVDGAIKDRYPYTICAVEDLELCMGIMGQVGISAFMGEKISKEHNSWPMFPFMRDKFGAELKQVKRSLFEAAFKKIHPAFT
jgi:hypothetical protein